MLSHYTPVKDSKAIPTGEIAPVEGTPFDFTEAKPIGRDIEANDTQLHYGSGYDHNFAIDKTAPGVEKVATAYSPESGIQMDVYTDCVGIQLYTANFIVGQEGKGGVKYNNRDAFCLETQFYPNSINETNFRYTCYKGRRYIPHRDRLQILCEIKCQHKKRYRIVKAHHIDEIYH